MPHRADGDISLADAPLNPKLPLKLPSGWLACIAPRAQGRWSVSASSDRLNRQSTAWRSSAPRMHGKTLPVSRGVTKPQRRYRRRRALA